MTPLIAGLDEAGRGPWAGPLVMGAVLFANDPSSELRARLKDSKEMTASQREACIPYIMQQAQSTGVGVVQAGEIDAWGLSMAVRIAMLRALGQLAHQPTALVLDANIHPFQQRHRRVILSPGERFDPELALKAPWTPPVPQLESMASLLPSELHENKEFQRQAAIFFQLPFWSIVRGEQAHHSIAAASILAKVTRDALMMRFAQQYPEYGFERHKGYGTAFHREQLATHGICPLHRCSYKPVKQYLHP